jgi:hypothetical protein
LEQFLTVVAPILAAADWKTIVAALIGAVAALGGAFIGAWAALRAQTRKHDLETALARRSLAAALRGELLAYFAIVARRKQVEAAQEALAKLQRGEPTQLPVLLAPGDEPLPSMALATDFRAVGSLGPALAEDIAKLASMIGSLRATLISVAQGRYAHLDDAGQVALLEAELELWRDLYELGQDVARTLARVARS